MNRRLALIPLLAAMVSCERHSDTLPPIGQVLLYIDTDAPLPPGAGESLGPNDPTPLFDRVRIEVISPGSEKPCSDCTHEFDLDRTIVGRGQASVGIHPPFETSGYIARVRLFRAIDADLGEPRADATIDVTVALPPIAPEGIRAVTALLLTSDVGKSIGSRTAPLPAIEGAPAGGRAGSWPPAQRRPCNGTPGPGEVCVPGGAYWMGSALPSTPGDASSRRIASVAPFFIDVTEVTVAAFRESGLAIEGNPFDLTAHPTRNIRIECLYSKTNRNNDGLPVNCVSWDLARTYCLARDADLPTEAQFQYVASGLGRSRYVWGNDAPTCEDAVWARSQRIFREYKCAGTRAEQPGSGARDRLLLPTGTILDLAGNIAEYTLDIWNLEREACWGTGVFVDPLCDVDRATPHGRLRHTVVGGSYGHLAIGLTASYREEGGNFANAMADERDGTFSALAFVQTGFRCVRPAL